MEDSIIAIRKSSPLEPIEILHIKNITSKILRLTGSAIIFGEQKYLETFHNKARLYVDYPKELKFLMYTKNLKVFNSTNYLFDDDERNSVIHLYEYFLHDQGDKIDFVTFEWFTARACNKRQKRVINTFNKTSLKWEKQFDIKEKKFRNFHGCKIVVMQDKTPSLGGYIKFGKPEGHSFDILDVVGSAANFSVYRQLGRFFKGERYFNIHNNAKLQPQVIVEIRTIKNNKYHTTGVFENVKVMIVVTQGEPYNAYEKLLLPFDVTIWYLLLLIFGTAFCIIFVINQTSKKLKNLLYGNLVQNPAFNVLGTFFGIPQSRLPSTNFPRIILISFVLFCLVIRTAYQGVFFELMATNMSKPVPNSFEKLLDENYTIYVLNNSAEMDILKSTYMQRRKISLQTIGSNKSDVCAAFPQNANKRAVMITDVSVPVFTSICYQDPTILKDPFITFSVAMIICQNHFLFHAINEAVEKTIPSGIPQHWYDFAKWNKIVRFLKTFPKGEVKSLTLNEWSFGFVVWLICCGISTSVFIIEILQWPEMKEKLKKRVKKPITMTLDVNILREIEKSLDFEIKNMKCRQVKNSNDLEVEK